MQMHREDEMSKIKAARLSKKNIEKKSKKREKQEKQARKPHTKEVIQKFRLLVSFKCHCFIYWS